MADPLSILGAAVGVTSLIVQTVDECIKGRRILIATVATSLTSSSAYQYYAKAVGMPDEYRYCRIRLQIEQQRFLNFGLEAGVLYTDGTLCETLRSSSSLLLAVLAEIKTLFEEFAKRNGKYEQAQGQDRWNGEREPETDLVTLICPPVDDPDSASFVSDEKKHQHLNKLRRTVQGIVQTGKNLRTIALEPKRLIWASVDKSSFESLITKLGALNSFLTSLLDSARVEKLQLTMDTSYNEILQIRDDIKGLSGLVEALSSGTDERVSSPSGAILHDTPIRQSFLREMETQKKKQRYLKRLAQVKIRYKQIGGQMSTDIVIPGRKRLDLLDFNFKSASIDQEFPESHISAGYDDRNVLIEWSSYHSIQQHTDLADSRLEDRIRLLTNLLCDEIPAVFRLPPCLGYLSYNHDDQTWFGIVFERPPNHAISQVVTLRELLLQQSVPSLSARISLCATLAGCVHTFHTVDWVHKGLRSEKIAFFQRPLFSVDITEPFILGYELSRPNILDELSEKPRFNPREDIYRHPFAQSSQSSGDYRKSYDIYSLGILFIEIATWKPIEKFLGFENLNSAKPSELIAVQKRLLGEDAPDNCLQHISSILGDSYKEIVELCLRADEVERPVYDGETRTSMAVRLQRTLEQNVVRKLGDMKRAMSSSPPFQLNNS
ncbi:hypothetical protein PENSTE_c025G08877 [Penicillium steckii]|uniref:Protein kinase domain-containing protein n=1 Tax=Penicillium steckii TaxID=303698 RepID=A0A1V6SQ09_9EURO|nr:hypothetical protein PENSTE_c025G08877 [Penicillium steckii]